MLTAVVCGLLCGQRGYSALVEWLHDLPVDVWHWMGYPRRPPKLDCFRDLLMKLDPAQLERLLREWITTTLEIPAEALSAVSLNGKSWCATLRPFARAVHLLAAVDHATGYVLSQCRVEGKTNEHKAALELLQTLTLKGRVVVGDAMFCQQDVCNQILAAEGDDFLAVKENQPGLLRDIALELTAPDGAFSPLQPAPASLGA